MVLISAGLAWLSGLDLVTPATLLLFTFLIGIGTALTGPAWQASVRGIVPQGELAAAVTLNAIAMNFARAVGPAVGGAVVAAAGAGAAFYLNAACTLVLAGALLWWPYEVPSDDLPRERVGSAIVTGLRYVAEASGLRAVLARGMVFGLAASAALALCRSSPVTVSAVVRWSTASSSARSASAPLLAPSPSMACADATVPSGS
jgi:MFS family permease